MTYPGGKGNAYHKIINLIPPHEVYIEPFLGRGYRWLSSPGRWIRKDDN